MKNKAILVGTFLSLAVVIGCGDDDTPDQDAGPDASDDASVTDSGNETRFGGRGGSGGRGGNGGSGGAAGSAGAGAGGSGGSGGAGSGGSGGRGASTHTVGGSVTALLGSGLKLKNNGGDELAVSGSTFEFSTSIASGEDYAVTVSAQPSNPAQECTVTSGTGEVGSEDVDDVQVTCVTGKYSIKGSLASYTGSGLVLNNNGGDALTPSGNAFEFSTKLASGANYAVTVATQPATQTCAVSMGSGQVGSSDVTSVSVACHDKNVLQVEPSFGSAIARWNNTGAESYSLKLTTDANCDLTTASCPGPAEITNATAPYSVPNLTNGTPYYFQLTANYPGGGKSLSNRTATRPSAARYDGEVYALATAASGTTYAGGTFTRLSVHTGAAVPVHKTSGFPSELPNFPIVDADVYAVAPDGSGGYFIGGTFTAIGADARAGLAHIKADATVDPIWNPGVSGGIVRSIAVHGTTVYISGDFTNIASTARAGLAAVSAADGSIVAAWNPNPMPAGSVKALAFFGDDVLVGGSFTNIATVAQSYLALVDGATGALETWTPAPDNVVNAIATNGNTIYVGGDYFNIAGQPRSRLAAFEGTAAAPTAWDPGPDNAVTRISFASNTVYIAGLFGAVGAATRKGVAAIDAADAGAVKDWNPITVPDNSVVNLVASADTVYLSGSFTEIGGMPRSGTAAVSGSGSGALLPWNPNPDGVVEAFAVVGDSVVMGGQYRGLGGLARKHLVAYGSNGGVTTWSAEADDNVYALATAGTTVYVGGTFGMLGGAGRNNVGAVEESGTLADWNPNVDNDVYALTVDGSTVYIGGAFGNVGPAGRAGIAAVGVADGLATSWNPGADNVVRAIAVGGGTVYAGGDFVTFGGAARNHLAAVSTGSNTADGWNPNVTGTTVRAVAVGTNTVIVGGDFTAIGADARANLAAIATSTGVATAFAPNPSGVVYAVVFKAGAIYVGGEFLTIGPLPNNGFQHMAAFDDQGVVREDYDYDYDLAVRALSVGATNMYVGGDFRGLNGAYVSGFSVLPL